MPTFRDGTNPHNLKARGAAFSLPNLTQVEEGTGGTGVALCACGWYSEVLPSGRARKAAHAKHKADAAELTVNEDWLDEDGLPFNGPLPAKVDWNEDPVTLPTDEQVDEAAAPVPEEDVIGPFADAEEILDAVADQLAETGHVEIEDGVVLDTADGGRSLSFDVADELAEEGFVGVSEAVPYEWRGNYSIVFAPATAELAETFGGVETKQVNHSAVRRTVILTGEAERVKEFVTLLDRFEIEALKHLKEWQLTHRAERRGLTDMQKFIQHRNVLASFTAVFAARLP